MLDRFIINKVTSAKSLVLVAYRVEDEVKVSAFQVEFSRRCTTQLP